jgi:hypothetical protein
MSTDDVFLLFRASKCLNEGIFSGSGPQQYVQWDGTGSKIAFLVVLSYGTRLIMKNFEDIFLSL